MFTEAIAEILTDQCQPAQVRRMESGSGADSLWSTMQSSGFLELLAPEDQGGAGMAWSGLFDIVHLLGRHAMPVPLAETMAARALVAPGVSLPEGMLTLASSLRRAPDGSLTGARVPFGRIARHVLAAIDGRLWLLDAAQAERMPTPGPTGQDATLHWPGGRGATALAGDGHALAPMAAALYAALIAGAASRAFEMTLEYGNQRRQFGKSLGQFQAVQHRLSVMAEHLAAATLAAETAFQSPLRPMACAVAKARCSEAALLIANTAHALHGAIGITQEYDLQLHTRRLHAWRTAHGSEDHWNDWIGRQVLADPRPLADITRD